VYLLLCLVSPPPGKPYNKIMGAEDLLEGHDTSSSPYEGSVEQVKGDHDIKREV
jgi:hypothetical protein